MSKLLKIISIIPILLFFCINQSVFADLSNLQTYPQQQIYEYTDFTKLLYSNDSLYHGPEGTANVAQNLRANLSVGALSKRLAMTKVGSDGTGEVTSLYRYYKANGSKFRIATQTTTLDYVDDTTGTATNIDTGLTSGKRWTYVTYKDDLIGMNGYDNAQKWDGLIQITANTTGSRTAGSLSADLGSTFATQLTGANLTASRWYQYRIAYSDGTSYWYSNNRSNPILTGSTVKDLNLTDIPLGATGITKRYIYRTAGQTSLANVLADNTFYYVDTINDNATRVYADHIADATITADRAPTWATVSAGTNVTVPKGKYCNIHQELLFIAGDPNNQSFLYYSNTLNPDWFDPINYEQVRPDDGDAITFIVDYLGILTIGKTNTISKLYTTDPSPSNWVLTAPFSFIGCPAPYTVVVTPIGIIYVGRDGIYQFTGQTSQLISDVITDKVRDFNQVNVNDFAGIFFRNEYHLSYTSIASGSPYNDNVLVLDTVRNAYEIDTEKISSWSILNSGTDFGVLESGSSSDGSIYAHNSAPTALIQKTLSDLQAGSVNWVDILGTQDNPTMNLGWGTNWQTITRANWASFPSQSTWIVQNQTGTWISPAIQVNATALQKLYWNPTLGANGSITFAIRTASTSAGISGAAWSSEFSNSAGADVSGVSANIWIQLRATFKTTDWLTSPALSLEDNYVIELAYQKSGSATEPTFLTLYNSGFNNWGHQSMPKCIRSIDVYYTGTAGTLNIGFNNSDGDVNLLLPINLAQTPTGGMKPIYKGSANGIKVYHYEPPFNSVNTPSPIGLDWQLIVNEQSTTAWAIQRIVVVYDVLNKQTQ